MEESTDTSHIPSQEVKADPKLLQQHAKALIAAKKCKPISLIST
jgi:hypothetical protein